MGVQSGLEKIKQSNIFQIAVTTVILSSSILVGIGTYDFQDSRFLSVLATLDILITIFFIVEILIRFFSEKDKRDFFKDGWNLFDSVIVISSIIPAGSSSVMVLRLLRLARLLRVISFMPELRFVIEALIELSK